MFDFLFIALLVKILVLFHVRRLVDGCFEAVTLQANVTYILSIAIPPFQDLEGGFNQAMARMLFVQQPLLLDHN